MSWGSRAWRAALWSRHLLRAVTNVQLWHPRRDYDSAPSSRRGAERS
jgi:hypothetical protein